MTQDRPLLGILLMVGFCALAPLGDSIAKILGDTIPLAQLLLVRFVAQFLLLLPVILVTGRAFGMRNGHTLLVVLRTLLHIIGIGAMFTSLRYLPIADAISIAFVMPFIMLLLGKYVLGESVGPRRLIACIVGFIGTLFVIQPSFVEVGAPALLPLLVAVAFSLFMLITRRIAKETDPLALQATSGLIATPVLLAAIFIGETYDYTPASLVWPTNSEWLLLLAIGLIGTLAHLLMTWSLRFAPSATVAPMQYIEIPFATLLGWMIFKDLPNGLAAIGIAITVAAGIYIILREHKTARAAL